MNAILSERPTPIRWLVAVLATALAAPLLSPVYWIWGFVAFEGSAGFADMMGGLFSGAMVAYAFSWPAVVVGVPLFAAFIYRKFDLWARRNGWLWFVLGASIASVAVIGVLALFGGEDGAFVILPAIGACAPAGGLAALIFRCILVRPLRRSNDSVAPYPLKAKNDV